MAGLSLYDKPSNSQSSQPLDLEQSTKLIELFQSTLQQNKIHIAYEVRAAVFEDLSCSFSQQLIAGIEELHRSIGVAFDNLEQKLSDRIFSLETKLIKLENDSQCISSNQQKIDEKVCSNQEKIKELQIKNTGIEQFVWNVSEDTKKMDNLLRKFYDHLLEINGELAAIKASLDSSSWKPIERPYDMSKNIEILKTDITDKIIDEKSQNIEFYRELKLGINELKENVQYLGENHNKHKLSLEKFGDWCKGLQSSIMQFECRIAKLDGEMRIIRQKEEKLEDSEKKNEEVRKLIHLNERIFTNRVY
ncbi:unnamed protein product [Blepharisma stoltei]|uniref:Uncharacterized protein n=1 Tax=Blepharisma stoltei TaxID=1481888 RepID=A0AAU9K7S4_9CILI|nr:unnamed protein product [Blepharisma stoltei]